MSVFESIKTSPANGLPFLSHHTLRLSLGQAMFASS